MPDAADAKPNGVQPAHADTVKCIYVVDYQLSHHKYQRFVTKPIIYLPTTTLRICRELASPHKHALSAARSSCRQLLVYLTNASAWLQHLKRTQHDEACDICLHHRYCTRQQRKRTGQAQR